MTTPDTRDAAKLSHARNAEDIVLARAFGGQPAGSWLDIAEPGPFSATRLLAERGWQGVDLAPSAAGDLDAALRRHAPAGGIDVLRVDVPHAGDLLAGTDWKGVRPRVLVVVAVDAAGAPTHQGWHRRLINACGYRFALFDGINRFYAREEDAEALLPRLALPANALDGFMRAADADRIAALEAALADARAGAGNGPEPRAAERELAPDDELAGLRNAAARVPELESELAAARDAAARVPALESELAGLREMATRVLPLESELAALRQAADRVPALEGELESLRQASQQLVSRADAAARDVRALETALAQARAATVAAQLATEAERTRAASLQAQLATAQTAPPPKSGGALGWLTGSGRGR